MFIEKKKSNVIKEMYEIITLKLGKGHQIPPIHTTFVTSLLNPVASSNYKTSSVRPNKTDNISRPNVKRFY